MNNNRQLIYSDLIVANSEVKGFKYYFFKSRVDNCKKHTHSGSIRPGVRPPWLREIDGVRNR